MGNKRIDIIVPCYNEEQNIEAFYSEVQAVAAQIKKSGAYENSYDFAYIFIDDGSKDGTLEQIRRVADQAAAGQTTVKYISFSRNFGKEAAMFAGLRASADASTAGEHGAADFAVIMDADLQHPPRLIADMLKKVEETGCDSVAARRVSRKGEPKIRSIFARLFYKLMNKYCEIEIVDGAVDFRLMSKRMVKAIADMPETQRFSKGIFAWVGFDTQWIEFENVQRLSGETKWTVWGLTKYAIDGFIDFADSPLKFAGAFGGFIAADSSIINWLRHNTRTYIFSASNTPAATAAALEALHIIQQEPERIERLWDVTRYALQRFRDAGFEIGETESPIIPLYVRDTDKTFVVTQKALDEGVFINPVIPPACAPQDTLVRFALMATHTREHVDQGVDRLTKVFREMGIIK